MAGGFSPLPSGARSPEFGVRRLPLPSRDHRHRGALVSAVRAVLPRRRGAARRAGDRGRSRDGVPVGATLHTAARRRCPAVPTQCRRPLVCGRDLREGRGTVALRLPRHRPIRPDHRRLRLRPRDTEAARRFFTTALRSHGEPTEVATDRAWALLVVVHEVLPAAFHNTSQYANNRIEADHGRLKARLRPMRGLKRDHTARVIVRGHALVQNLRRATTSSVAMPAPIGASRPRSPNSPEPSERTSTAPPDLARARPT